MQPAVLKRTELTYTYTVLILVHAAAVIKINLRRGRASYRAPRQLAFISFLLSPLRELPAVVSYGPVGASSRGRRNTIIRIGATNHKITLSFGFHESALKRYFISLASWLAPTLLLQPRPLITHLGNKS